MASNQKRTPLANLDDIPGRIPQSNVPENYSPVIGPTLIQQLGNLHADHLANDALWRDFFALTGTFRTLYSAQTISEAFDTLGHQKQVSGFKLTSTAPRKEHCLGDSWLDFDVEFQCSDQGLKENCAGIVSVMFDSDGEWRIWMIRTWLENFEGHGHPDVLAPANGSVDIGQAQTQARTTTSNVVYDCIVVGGGQSGLALAGRLKALGVSYVLLEKYAEIGDVWNKRYESLRWHTSKEYGSLALGHRYADSEEYMMPTKRIGANQNAWAQKFNLNVVTGIDVDSARFDSKMDSWTVEGDRSGRKQTFLGRNLVLSTGSGASIPRYPSWAQPEAVAASGYKGAIVHGLANYDNPKAWAGKHGIVVGTANTAHDIAEDMVDAGINTTMVQRSPTFVFSADWLHFAQNMVYNKDIATAVADRRESTKPFQISRQLVNQNIWHMIRQTSASFDALEAAGFRLDRFGDISYNLFVRSGGHYLDTGASARIANGEIKVKAGAVNGLTPNGLVFEDGMEVPADVIVLCTGFTNDFRTDATRILGHEIADQMDEYWGPDKYGEIRGLAKPAGFPHLYYLGGDVRMARWYSRFVALQIQADLLGHPFQPF